MKDAFGGDFEKTLAKMKWPGRDIKLVGALEEEWIEGVKRLLELQEPYVRLCQLCFTHASKAELIV